MLGLPWIFDPARFLFLWKKIQLQELVLDKIMNPELKVADYKIACS